MSAISAISSYGNVYGGTAAPRRDRSEVAPGISAAAAGSTVSISAAAREAAANDPATRSGLKLADFVMQWFDKDFPQDVLDEAKARLADIQAHGELGAAGPLNLPLLPENQALQESFRQERRELSAAGHANMTEAQSARFNLLMNLDMRLQLTGWNTPMTEADVQREFDVANAMAKLVNADPSLRPEEKPATCPEDLVADIPDIQWDGVPSVWEKRWEAAGLVMPEDVVVSPERGMWLEVAAAAGIGEDEFLAQARELAGSLKGHALTRALETLISERYAAMREAQAA